MSDTEENTTLNVEETEAAKKAAEEAAEAKRVADEAAAKKAAEEAAEAKRIADEAAAKKAAEEAAAKKASDEAAEAKRADEAAAKKAAEEATEAKRVSDEAAELTEQLVEFAKLNAITNKLWEDGKKSNYDNMSHTEIGVKKSELYKRGKVHQNFMTSLTKTSQRRGMSRSTPSSTKSNRPSLNTRQTVFNSGMMFGNRR